MRTFTMYRRADLSATHDANQVNPPEEPQFEGVVFSDGSVAIRWLTAKRSISVWASLDDALAVHGHPEYESELVWREEELAGVLADVTFELATYRANDEYPSSRVKEALRKARAALARGEASMRGRMPRSTHASSEKRALPEAGGG